MKARSSDLAVVRCGAGGSCGRTLARLHHDGDAELCFSWIEPDREPVTWDATGAAVSPLRSLGIERSSMVRDLSEERVGGSVTLFATPLRLHCKAHGIVAGPSLREIVESQGPRRPVKFFATRP